MTAVVDEAWRTVIFLPPAWPDDDHDEQEEDA